MKWLFLVVVVFVLLNVSFSAAALPQSEPLVRVESISHVKNTETNETITFRLAASVTPKIFTLGGEKPRLVIDFPKSVYLGKNAIPLTDSNLASTIRIALHKTPIQRTRVVVDLSKKISVQHASEYSEQDKTLTLTLTAEDVEPTVSATTQLMKKQTGEDVVEFMEPTLLDISFDDSSGRGEMVLFRLNDFFPPTVSALETGNPRVLCDFMHMNLNPDVSENIVVNGKFIQRIRTARHKNPQKVRVVLDLSPNRDYDLQQIFFRNDNLFVLIVNELTPKQATQ
ncbi:MAG: AMIN domain-containing protein [Desulforhopalus sp.]